MGRVRGCRADKNALTCVHHALVFTLLVSTAWRGAAQAQPPANASAVMPANTSLNEYKGAAAAAAVSDPGGSPAALCPLTAPDLASTDRRAVSDACGERPCLQASYP